MDSVADAVCAYGTDCADCGVRLVIAPSPPVPPMPPQQPSPASPPRVPPRSALEDLNIRFRDASASSDLAAAGILVHIWDETESETYRWRGCPNNVGVPEVDGGRCISFGDRFSASLIGRRKFFLFRAPSPGVLLRPEANAIFCAYAADADSRSRGATGCSSDWCPRDLQVLSDRNPGACNNVNGRPYRPEDLDVMLEWWIDYGQGYNEIMVDTGVLNNHLPRSVEAFLCDRQTHAQFLEHYHISDPNEYPLVGFDIATAYVDAPDGRPGPFYLLDEDPIPEGEPQREGVCH